MQRRARRRAQAASPAVEDGAEAGGETKAQKEEVEEPAESGKEDLKEEGEEGEDDEGSGDDDGSDLDLDFEFFDPNEDDYHSVGDLLKSGTWEFADLNFSELADSIVGQGNIGTLVKSDAGGTGADKDTTLCGMLTVLNLRQFKGLSWAKALGEALLARARKHASAEVVQKLRGLLEDKPEASEVGLMVNERFANLPPQLVAPLHRALQEDIEWSCSTPECPEDERPFYRFTHFLGVARCFEAAAPSSSSVEGLRKGKKRRTGSQLAAESSATKTAAAAAAPSGAGNLFFLRDEEGVYVRKASFSFTFPLPSAAAERRLHGKAGRGQELRVVFGITRKAFEQAVKELEARPLEVDTTG